MKKMIFGLCALVACFVFASCGGDQKAVVEDLIEKVKDVKTADEAISLEKEYLQAQIDFVKGDPSVEEAQEFDKKCKEFEKAAKDVKLSDEEKAKYEENYKKETKDLKEELEKAGKEWAEKHKEELEKAVKDALEDAAKELDKD